MFDRWRKPKTRRAGVYKFARHYVVATSAKIPRGIQMEIDWTALPTTASASELGDSVLRAFDRFQEVKTLPKDTGPYQDAVAKRCAIPASAIVLSKALCVHLENDGNTASITPSRNGGVTGDDRGQHSLDDQKFVVNYSSSDELGLAILKGFELSKVVGLGAK
jgi:hypothetical protein